MAVTLQLPQEIEAQLTTQANARGLSLEDYLKKIVELQAVGGDIGASGQNLNYEDWEREFEVLIDNFPQQPVLSDEAISRESIYTREDEM